MLASAAAAIRLKIGTPPKPDERDRIARTLDLARTRISVADYDSAWQEGKTVSLDRVLALAPNERP
jgi:hypothetical protein